jgi:hypothetical protein
MHLVLQGYLATVARLPCGAQEHGAREADILSPECAPLRLVSTACGVEMRCLLPRARRL